MSSGNVFCVFFMEHVQYVNGFRKLGDVHQAKRATDADANLDDTGADG